MGLFLDITWCTPLSERLAPTLFLFLGGAIRQCSLLPQSAAPPTPLTVDRPTCPGNNVGDAGGGKNTQEPALDGVSSSKLAPSGSSDMT